MTLLALEIHDAGILLRSHPPALPLPASPGYAFIEGDTLLTGAEAAARARLKPKQTNNCFWSELNTAPLSGSFPGRLSHADLAHAHLCSIWEKVAPAAGPGAQELLLAIPGSYSDQQLGLILGIARACRMPVVGMIDAALASIAEPSVAEDPGKHLLHLDLQLHQTVVTEMTRAHEIVRRRVELIRQLGLDSLREKWVRCIAAAFVRHTRFDPLHAAATEQELYNALPSFLRQISAGDSAVLEIGAGQKVYSVELAREEIVAAVEAEYQEILHLIGTLKRAGEQATLLLSHRAASLPGLWERLAQIGGTDRIALPEGAAASGALSASARIHFQGEGESVPFITRLPVEAEPRAAESAVPPERPPEAGIPAPAPARTLCPRAEAHPTHILYEGKAYPLGAEPFVLGIAIPAGRRGINLRGRTAGISRSHCSIYREQDRVVVEDHSTHGSFLNGQRLEGQAELALGDRLRLGSPGIELLLICVADGLDPDEP